MTTLIKKPTPRTQLDELVMVNTQLINAMKLSCKKQFDLVWNNRHKTAQEMFDLLGVLGKKAIDDHYALQLLIKSVDSDWVFLVPPLSYTVNVDDTVTVIYPEPEPEPQPEPEGEQP